MQLHLKNLKLPALGADNARIHHYKKFTTYVNSIKRKVIYNVPYTPIFNPIEYVFNSLKMYDPALPVRFAKHLRCKFYHLYINNNMHRRCLAKRAGEAGATT